MADSARIVLHEYRTTFLVWLLILFIGISCLILSMSTAFPYFMWDKFFDNGEPKIDQFIAIGIGYCAGLGLPVLGLLLVLFVPAITTSLDPARRVVIVEKRRPLWKSSQEFSAVAVADIRPIVTGSSKGGRGLYSVALILKSGEEIRLEYSSTSEKTDREQAAARARAVLQPYLS